MSTVVLPIPANSPTIAYERLVELLAAGDELDAPLVEAIITGAGKTMLVLAGDVASRAEVTERSEP